MKTAQRKTDCWIWPYTVNSKGYGNIGKGKKVYEAHRFIFETILRPVPANCELDHLCKNKLCVNPDHLEPVSHKENCLRGKQTKLTTNNVKEIRSMAGKFSQRLIAEKFGVSRACIGYILQGKRWV